MKLHSNRKSTNIQTIGKRRCIDKTIRLNLSAKKPLYIQPNYFQVFDLNGIYEKLKLNNIGKCLPCVQNLPIFDHWMLVKLKENTTIFQLSSYLELLFFFLSLLYFVPKKRSKILFHSFRIRDCTIFDKSDCYSTHAGLLLLAHERK